MQGLQVITPCSNQLLFWEQIRGVPSDTCAREERTGYSQPRPTDPSLHVSKDLIRGRLGSQCSYLGRERLSEWGTARLSGRDFCSQGLAYSLSQPFTVSSQLKCFPPQILPLSPNFFLLVAFEAQYYTKVSFQQNACDYQITRGLPVVYNLAMSKAASHLDRT